MSDFESEVLARLDTFIGQQQCIIQLLDANLKEQYIGSEIEDEDPEITGIPDIPKALSSEEYDALVASGCFP